MLALFSGDILPHFKQEEIPFPSSFAKPFRGSTVPAFPAIRCFPFLAVGHAPFYRQRKRSLGFARDDDTRRMRFPHTLSLHDARDIHSLHCHFERSREILLALCSSLPLSRKASNFPLSHIGRYTPYRHFERSEKSSLHFVASCSFRKRFPIFHYHTYDIIPSCKKDPSTSLGMTIQE